MLSIAVLFFALITFSSFVKTSGNRVSHHGVPTAPTACRPVFSAFEFDQPVPESHQEDGRDVHSIIRGQGDFDSELVGPLQSY